MSPHRPPPHSDRHSAGPPARRLCDDPEQHAINNHPTPRRYPRPGWVSSVADHGVHRVRGAPIGARAMSAAGRAASRSTCHRARQRATRRRSIQIVATALAEGAPPAARRERATFGSRRGADALALPRSNWAARWEIGRAGAAAGRLGTAGAVLRSTQAIARSLIGRTALLAATLGRLRRADGEVLLALLLFLAAASSIAVPPKARPKAPPTTALTTLRRSRWFPASRFIHPSNRGPSTPSSSHDILRDRSLRRDGCAATANATAVDARSAGSAGVDSGDHLPRGPACAYMPYLSPQCIGLVHDSAAVAGERCADGRGRQRAEGVMANDTRFAALARRLGLARTFGWGSE